LRHDIAQREVEVLAVVLPSLVPEHRHHAPHGVFPDDPLVAEAAIERMQFGDARTFTDSELDAAAADQVEGGYALDDPSGMVRGELHDAVAETDVLRALAGGGEK